MADTVESNSYLGITVNNNPNNEEAKNQTIKIPNPSAGVTEQSIKNAVRTLINNSVIIDNTGTPYDSNSEIVTAYTEYSTVQTLDIGIED